MTEQQIKHVNSELTVFVTASMDSNIIIPTVSKKICKVIVLGVFSITNTVREVKGNCTTQLVYFIITDILFLF
jgi:hypothetical protein